jgi:hypothetical protein
VALFQCTFGKGELALDQPRAGSIKWRVTAQFRHACRCAIRSVRREFSTGTILPGGPTIPVPVSAVGTHSRSALVDALIQLLEPQARSLANWSSVSPRARFARELRDQGPQTAAVSEAILQPGKPKGQPASHVPHGA